MAFTYPTYQQDPYEGESEDDRRRRLAAEQAQAQAQAQDQENGLSQRNPDPSFGDIASQAFDLRMGNLEDRINTAKGYFTNPQAALQQRLGVPATNQPAAEPTPVKQTITTDPETGEQTVKIEGSARDLSAANPLTPTIVGPVSPEQQAQQQQQFAQQIQQYRAPQAQPRTMAPLPVVEQLPAQGPISPQAAQMPVPQPQLPQPGPGVQVASAQPGMTAQPPQPVVPATPAAQIPGLPSLAQIAATPAAAPAPAAPVWITAANEAGTDFNRLLDVAAKHPESRDFINDKLTKAFANKGKQDEADKLFKDAAAGDIKAQNKVFQMIKPETGKPKEEVTTGDFVRAYMYKRLGLDALALDVQNKIIGKETKFGQITIGGTNWATETDPSGNIIRAKDDDGNVATEATLNKLRAAGQKFGSQAYSSTGGSQVIPAGQPDAGEEYRSVFNSTSGNFENKITTGANAGKTYIGPAGQDKSVSTQGAKALNQAFIDFNTKPTTAAATEALKAAALLGNDAYNQTLAAIRSRSPEIFGQLPPGAGIGGVAAAPAAAADPAAARRAQGDVESLTREIALAQSKPFGNAQQQAGRLQYLNDEMAKAQQRLQQSGGTVPVSGGTVPVQGGGSLLKQTEQAKANIGTAAAIETTRGQEAVKNVEKLATDTATNADAASQTATVARRIRTAVTDNPEIPGMLTKTNNKGLDVITAAVAAIDAGLGGSDAIQAAAKQMNFNARQVAVFDQIKGDLTELALARARENKGQGTFTDFERRLFAETTGNLARNPASAIQYRMEIFEYASDKTARKSEFIEDYRSRNLNATAGQINNAWRKETKKADDEFEKRLRDTYINPKMKVIR